tara:strand:+ start:520 stop:636 length:117 start_codon:yes stop_codon:yes gene_type:complete
MNKNVTEKMAQKPIDFGDPSAVSYRRQNSISEAIGARL